jgi:fumarylpyruvate hydrolase
MQYVLTAAPTHSLPVQGIDARFPVNRIFCVGRNYAAHAREMGKDPTRELPFFFMKPASALVDASQGETTIPYPPRTRDFHHEVELVVAIGRGGADVPVERALEHVYGYAVGLDMTRRDLQLEARDKGRPWEFGKSFAASAPIGALRRGADVGQVADAAISLAVNGAIRQSSNIAKLIWSVAESIAHLSAYDALLPGDLLMTGTPEGVGAVVPGDLMVAVGTITVRVGPAAGST